MYEISIIVTSCFKTLMISMFKFHLVLMGNSAITLVIFLHLTYFALSQELERIGDFSRKSIVVFNISFSPVFAIDG